MICEVYLRPRVLFELASRQQSRNTWRIAMHVGDPSLEHRMHPWICFDVTEMDVSLKDQYQVLQPETEVQESAPREDTESYVSPLNWCSSSRVASLNLQGRMPSYANFKTQRSDLFDENLKAMREPKDDGEDHRCLNNRWSKRACHGAFFLLVLISGPRFYMMSCYHQYEWIAVAEGEAGKLHNKSASMIWTNPELYKLWEECQEDTIGLADSTLAKDEGLHYCRPSPALVEKTCRENTTQPAPRAFKEAIDLLQVSGGFGEAIVRQLRRMDKFTYHISQDHMPQYFLTGGIPCPCQVVALRNKEILFGFRFYALTDLFAIFLIVFILLMRCRYMPHRILPSV